VGGPIAPPTNPKNLNFGGVNRTFKPERQKITFLLLRYSTSNKGVTLSCIVLELFDAE